MGETGKAAIRRGDQRAPALGNRREIGPGDVMPRAVVASVDVSRGKATQVVLREIRSPRFSRWNDSRTIVPTG